MAEILSRDLCFPETDARPCAGTEADPEPPSHVVKVLVDRTVVLLVSLELTLQVSRLLIDCCKSES